MNIEQDKLLKRIEQEIILINMSIEQIFLRGTVTEKDIKKLNKITEKLWKPVICPLSTTQDVLDTDVFTVSLNGEK